MHRIFYVLKQAGAELRYLQFETKLSSPYFFYEFLKISFKNTQPSDFNCVKNKELLALFTQQIQGHYLTQKSKNTQSLNFTGSYKIKWFNKQCAQTVFIFQYFHFTIHFSQLQSSVIVLTLLQDEPSVNKHPPQTNMWIVGIPGSFRNPTGKRHYSFIKLCILGNAGINQH